MSNIYYIYNSSRYSKPLFSSSFFNFYDKKPSILSYFTMEGFLFTTTKFLNHLV